MVRAQDNNVQTDWAESRGSKEDDECGVYMTNVKEDVEDEVFRKHFGKFGTIDKVRIQSITALFLEKRTT